MTILDAELGHPLPCRIHLKDSSHKPVRGPGLPFWHDHFVCDGTVDLDLSPGGYSYEIERGPEYTAARGELQVVKDAQIITNQLGRLANMAGEGWWSGDLHVHRPPTDVELLMQAGDLHVAPVITWWNKRNLWAKQPLPDKPLVSFDADRFYHLLGGEDEREGGALLFFNLNRPLEITKAEREYPSPMTFLRQAHALGAWVDVEKPFWYDMPVWLASGMVDSIGIAHNHMQRGGVLANEAWGRARDRNRWPDPLGNGYWTQEIYYHLLNCGLRVPPSAGSASGVLPNPVGYNRVYVHLEGGLTYEKWWRGLNEGRVFVSNGPLLRCRANGQFPGHVFKVPTGESVRLKFEVSLESREPVRALEIIQNGKVITQVTYADWRRAGALGTVTLGESGWCLVRAIGEDPHTFRFASTGPFYVEAGASPRRVSKTSAQFFLDWVKERKERIKLADPRRQEDVLAYHQQAERFWQEKLQQANAE